MKPSRFAIVLSAACLLAATPSPAAESVNAVRKQAEQWRSEHRTIDLHQHINYTTQHLSRAVRIMDAVGVGIEEGAGGLLQRQPARSRTGDVSADVSSGVAGGLIREGIGALAIRSDLG